MSFKVTPGARGGLPGDKAGVPPAAGGSEWDPLLHEACFSVVSFYSANDSGCCQVPCPPSLGKGALVVVVTADE